MVISDVTLTLTLTLTVRKNITIMHHSSTSAHILSFITIAHFMSEKIDSTFLLIWPNSLSSVSRDRAHGMKLKIQAPLRPGEGPKYS